VLEIERQGPDVVVLKRTRREKDQNRKEKSNRRLKRLCDALQRERNPVKIREIKNRLSDEFYNGDRA